MAEIQDEQLIWTASGARGIGAQGQEIPHYPVGYTGFPNTFVARDADHLMYRDGSRRASARFSEVGGKALPSRRYLRRTT